MKIFFQLASIISLGFFMLTSHVFAADKTFYAGEVLVLTENVVWDNLYSDATSSNWAVVTGPYNITVTGDTDISYISFQNTGSITLETGINVIHCVFEDQSGITFGTWKTELNIDWEVSSCDFRNITDRIRINSAAGTPSTGVSSLFTNNTISIINGSYKSIFVSNRNNFDFTETVLYNVGIGIGLNFTAAGGMNFKNFFLSMDEDYTTGGNLLMYDDDRPAINIEKSYMYTPYGNPHQTGSSGSGGSGTHTFTDNVFEVPYNYDGCNIINAMNMPRDVIGNILIGSGTLVNNVGTHSGGQILVRRNTIYKTYDDQGVGGIWLSESDDYTGDINIYSNINTSSVTNLFALKDLSAPPDQIITNSDYNAFYNITTPYSDVVISNGQGNDITADPDFEDPTRNLASWDTAEGSGNGTEIDAINYLLNKNGYDSVSKTQSNTPSPNTVSDLVNWVREGFIPQNEALKGTGFGGENIGAMDFSTLIWTGSSSTDWSTPTNWDQGFIPNASSDVIIPSTPIGGYFPETNSGSNAICKTLNLESGASLIIPSGKELILSDE